MSTRRWQVKLHSVPGELYVGQPSTVVARIMNHAVAPRKLRLDLITDKMQGVLINTLSGQLLGEASAACPPPLLLPGKLST